MGEAQGVQTSVLGTKQFVGDHPVAFGDLVQLKKTFTIALWERESNHDILRVLDRAAEDIGLIADLTYRGPEALEGYHLTPEAQAALLGGDIRWIETHVGKLSESQRTWLWCRLCQEIW
jgi:hypothetical protein